MSDIDLTRDELMAEMVIATAKYAKLKTEFEEGDYENSYTVWRDALPSILEGDNTLNELHIGFSSLTCAVLDIYRVPQRFLRVQAQGLAQQLTAWNECLLKEEAQNEC